MSEIINNPKIRSVEELGRIVSRLKEEKKKVVMCHGVFDLLHIGHIRHFEEAKLRGDVLVVTITADDFADKGPGRPAFSEQLRAEGVASIGHVDYVAINEWDTAAETLRIIRPHFFMKGEEFKNIDDDRTGKIAEERAVLDEIGAKFSYTGGLVFSSSNLINRYLSRFSDEINQYLSLLRTRYELEDFTSLLDRIADLKVLVIGDAILDEYQYCNAIGKSSKDPTMVVQYESHELFAGGVFAVANHLAGFASQVDMVTVLGGQDNYEKFIQSQLESNVAPKFFYMDDAPTTLKRRLVDSHSFSKLFEVYVMDDSGLRESEDDAMCRYVRSRLDDYDAVVISDFGHGAISSKLRDVLIDHPGFVAVNTQANAGNRGFHLISKYRNFDYACLALHEFALEIRNKKDMFLREEMLKVLANLSGKSLMVTLGRDGSAACTSKDDYIKVPSLSDKIVDRVGAGDAFFAVTSLAAALGAPIEIIGFLGNVVGAIAIQTIGNKKSIERKGTEKYITALLK